MWGAEDADLQVREKPFAIGPSCEVIEQVFLKVHSQAYVSPSLVRGPTTYVCFAQEGTERFLGSGAGRYCPGVREMLRQSHFRGRV